MKDLDLDKGTVGHHQMIIHPQGIDTMMNIIMEDHHHNMDLIITSMEDSNQVVLLGETFIVFMIEIIQWIKSRQLSSITFLDFQRFMRI
jgi:hypothetical protein